MFSTDQLSGQSPAGAGGGNSAKVGDSSGEGSGGVGYGGSSSNRIQSGGTNRAAFGTVNFGAGAKVGGTSAGDAGTGLNSTVLLYAGLGLGALLVVYLLFKR